jgi:hypothetical protein
MTRMAGPASSLPIRISSKTYLGPLWSWLAAAWKPVGLPVMVGVTAKARRAASTLRNQRASNVTTELPFDGDG